MFRVLGTGVWPSSNCAPPLPEGQKRRNSRAKAKNEGKRMRKAARNQYICTIHIMQLRHAVPTAQTVETCDAATWTT